MSTETAVEEMKAKKESEPYDWANMRGMVIFKAKTLDEFKGLKGKDQMLAIVARLESLFSGGLITKESKDDEIVNVLKASAK